MRSAYWSKRAVLLGWVVALLTAAWLPGSASALEPAQDRRGDKLERLWSHQQQVHERQARMLDGAQALIRKVEGVIQRAEANGKDTTALQAALDRFVGAVAEAERIHAQAAEIIAAHSGFDAAGQVTDVEQAKRSVEALSEKLQQFRSTLPPAFKALQAALREFQSSNRPDERPDREER
jgi:hypothetical protein